MSRNASGLLGKYLVRQDDLEGSVSALRFIDTALNERLTVPVVLKVPLACLSSTDW